MCCKYLIIFYAVAKLVVPAVQQKADPKSPITASIFLGGTSTRSPPRKGWRSFNFRAVPPAEGKKGTFRRTATGARPLCRWEHNRAAILAEVHDYGEANEFFFRASLCSTTRRKHTFSPQVVINWNRFFRLNSSCVSRLRREYMQTLVR